MKDDQAVEQVVSNHIPVERLSYSKKVKGWLAERYGAERAQANKFAGAKEAFACAELVFDATNTKGLEFANRYVKKTGNASALMHCAIDDPSAFAREAGCELLEVRPFYTSARRILKGKVNLYAKVAMAVTDRTGRAFLLHVRL